MSDYRPEQDDDIDKIVRDFQEIRNTGEVENPNRGRARERRQQRRERTQTTPAVSRRAARQTLPTERFRMPKIKIPFNRAGLYAVGSVIFVVLIVVVLGRLRNDPLQSQPNAIWIGTEWTYEDQTAESIVSLVNQLRDHRIGTVYAWVSWLQADETWRGEDNFARVQQFATLFNAAYPEANLYGWVSLPVDAGGYRMDSIDVQGAVAEFSARVVNEFGFEGVFLNIEPVWTGDENFLDLLRQVRASVGDAPISVAVPPDWSPVGAGIPVPPLIVPGTIWEDAYKQSVGLLVDEMAIMAYNSGLSSAADYSVWVSYQVQTFAKAVADLGAGTQLVIGIPTYDAEPPGHDPLVENVTSAVTGIIDGLERAGEDAEFVSGVAIYAGWTTDDAEWLEFMQNWVNR